MSDDDEERLKWQREYRLFWHAFLQRHGVTDTPEGVVAPPATPRARPLPARKKKPSCRH